MQGESECYESLGQYDKERQRHLNLQEMLNQSDKSIMSMMDYLAYIHVYVCLCVMVRRIWLICHSCCHNMTCPIDGFT